MSLGFLNYLGLLKLLLHIPLDPVNTCLHIVLKGMPHPNNPSAMARIWGCKLGYGVGPRLCGFRAI